ncbi:hypothetical protein ACHWQZ_G007736 [Mnemiopsis leidyi]
MKESGPDTKLWGTQYYDYNRHKLMFDSEDESPSLKNWEDQIACVDIPLLVDMSHWVGCITRSTLPYDMFLDKISDGIILCNFGNTVNAMTGFGARRQITNIMYPDSESEGESQHNGRHNIASFLQWCKTYGLERDFLFSVSDLADKRDGRRVLTCLLWVGRLAHKRGVAAPQIVKIEEKYGMRYYTFMARLISEPPLPAHLLFKEEEGQISKEKRGSKMSVTSFFGRRSSRASVNSNVSVSSSNLTSITEDRKKSIINGTNKKDKKKKRKESTAAAAVVDETELITPDSEIQQIYLQIMSLVYHKGFQRAKPRGYVNLALEEWQSDFHAVSPSSLPTEEFATIKSRACSLSSLNRTSPAPVALTPEFYKNTFGVEPTVDPLRSPAYRQVIQSVPELDSSSDGAFADDDVQPGAEKNRGSPNLGRGSHYGVRSPSKPPRSPDTRRGSPDVAEVSPYEPLDDPVDLAADKEVEKITGPPVRPEDDHDESRSQSISLNPKIDFDDVTDSDITGIKRKDRTKKSGHIKSPGPMDKVKQEQVIRNSDKVETLPEAGGTRYGSLQRGTSRQRSYSRQASSGGMSLGQVLLIIICPCRLCFGRR